MNNTHEKKAEARPLSAPLSAGHRPKGRGLRVALTVIALGAGAGLLWKRSAAPAQTTMAADAKKSSETTALLSVEAVRVEAERPGARRGNILSGQVEPERIATVEAEASERIVSRPVERGDRVAAGALLAALDRRTAQTEVDQARASYGAAVAARRQAQEDYRRASVDTNANRLKARGVLQGATAGRRQSETDYTRASVETGQDVARAGAVLRQATAARLGAQADYARAVEETAAGQQQARAQLRGASAGLLKARGFTRGQELRQAEAALSQAQSDERLAKIELDRYAYVVGEGALAPQRLDEARTAYESAVAKRQTAEQGLSLAREGARSEDQDAAAAQVQEARAQVRVAGTRRLKLAALARGIDTLRAKESEARAQLKTVQTRPLRLASLAQQIESQRAQETQAMAGVQSAGTRPEQLAALAQGVETLRAREELARANWQGAAVGLDKHQARSPFGGRVLETLAEVGETVSMGAPLVRVGSITRVKVSFAVPEAARSALTVGQSVQVFADALPSQKFRGRIWTLGFQADAKTRTFPLQVMVDNPGERLLPNMVARLRLPDASASRTSASRTGALLVPLSAVATDGDQSFVYVLRAEASGRAVTEKRVITLGAPVGDRVEVGRGLRAGERIAATPQRLSPGVRVQVLSPDAGTGATAGAAMGASADDSLGGGA